jgi:hypothetical protein
MEDVYGLEIDGTQIEDLDIVMIKKFILPPTFAFQQMLDGYQVGLDLVISLLVPND